MVCEETAEYGDLTPSLGTAGKPSSAQRLRDEMARQGIEVLDEYEVSIPSGSQQGGWTEMGKLDSQGHALGAGLAKQITAEVEGLADRVAALLAGGWTRIRWLRTTAGYWCLADCPRLNCRLT